MSKSVIPSCCAWLVAVVFVLISSVVAGPVVADDIQLQLTQVSDLSDVVDIANAGDGSGRLFLVQQSGRIYILDDDGVIEAPFLDIRDEVESMGNEQGLLSLAFAPDYAATGYFYVWYTGAGGDSVLARFRVSGNPDVADMQSKVEVLNVAQPRTNHNGGRLQFGHDGMLYLGLGDGGGSFDPDGSGQDGSTLLGKLIRIDVDPVHGTYAIPAGNPFVGNGAVRDEIWALGLRNPWRISFDRSTGDLFIADVGQNEFEEINYQAASSTGGENYGWSTMEGSQCVDGGCDTSGLVLPVSGYNHENNNCSITGGETYRGNAYPNLQGMYLFADYCTGRIWGLSRSGNDWLNTLLADTTLRIATFGLGEDGSVYVGSASGGVYLLSDGDVVPEAFQINAGLNDAWFDPATDGQGLLVAVFEQAGVMFLAWFTFDVERPPEDVMAIIGDPGARWFTLQGPFAGDTATLDLYSTSGGVFDASDPVAGPAIKMGTATIRWSSCNAAILTYQIDSPVLSGMIPLQRIVLDNVALCEALQ